MHCKLDSATIILKTKYNQMPTNDQTQVQCRSDQLQKRIRPDFNESQTEYTSKRDDVHSRSKYSRMNAKMVRAEVHGPHKIKVKMISERQKYSEQNQVRDEVI